MRDAAYEVGSITGLFLLLLGIYHSLQISMLALDAFVSLALLVAVWRFKKELHLDSKSFIVGCLALILHNMNLYQYMFILPFDRYMHFIGGFAVALAADRFLCEKLSLSKRVFLIMTIALGLGAFAEIVEWWGYALSWYGGGFFAYGVGDFGEYQNAMFDLMFNVLGAAVMGLIILFRK